MHKKGSLNLSIQAIVIIVLAMTLLGLGLGFVRNQFKIIGETATTVQEQTRQAILDDLRIGNKKLSFPTGRIILIPGERKDLAFGVKNTEDSTIDFTIVISRRGTTDFTILNSTTKSDGSFFWDDSDQQLNPGDSRVFGILHQAEPTKDTYLYKIEIKLLDDSSIYDAKTFFVTVG